MKFEAIIFDMDGTIINSENIWSKVIVAILKKRSITYCPKELDLFLTKLIGVTLLDCCLQLKKQFNLSNTLEELMQEHYDELEMLYQKELAFIPGFITFHQKLLNHNLKTGIATNSDDTIIAITNKVLNLKQFFGSHIYGVSLVNNKEKPDPAIFKYAAEQLDVSPEKCIAIEDSMPGIEAAKAAGMYCIAINTSKQRELLQHAHRIIDHYDEIDLHRILEKKP